MAIKPTMNQLRPLFLICIVCLSFAHVGCGGDAKKEKAAKETVQKDEPKKTATSKSEPNKPIAPQKRPETPPPSPAPLGPVGQDRPHPLANDRNLSDLLDSGDSPFESGPPADVGGGDEVVTPIPLPTRTFVDDAKVAAEGIRKLSGKHITLYTDLPSKPAVDELPQVFDTAFPIWCEYFGLNPLRYDKWHMIGRIIKDKDKFRRAGLFPDSLPPFRHGFQMGDGFWLYEQDTDYYRRHLFIHEGTHGFMNNLLGGAGQPWYMEGTAELFGTHKWEDGKLTVPYFPSHRGDLEQWDRTKLIQQEIKDGRFMNLDAVMKYGWRAHLQDQPYAWCWAIVWFLDQHPDSQKAFREMRKHARIADAGFSQRFYSQVAGKWPQLVEQWQLFAMNLDYGYDLQRELISYAPGKPLPSTGAVVPVLADRGWQSTGVVLQANSTYRIRAAGQYQIANDPKPWISEPGGVTIRYWQGRPLGMLIGAIRNDDVARFPITPLLNPFPIGLGRTFTPTTTGTLYLRVNDSPAELVDNAGELSVQILPK